MNELEKILVLVQELELDMIEKGHISDDCVYTDNFGKIKEMLYKESIK